MKNQPIKMNTVYLCPHCRAQNFATQKRLQLAIRVPLMCWKCGQKIEKPLSRKGPAKRGKAKDRKANRFLGDKD